MGYNLNFIYTWLKLSEDDYEMIYGMYNKSMKEMFKQIPLMIIQALSTKQNFQKLMTEIGGGSYIEKVLRY